MEHSTAKLFHRLQHRLRSVNVRPGKIAQTFLNLPYYAPYHGLGGVDSDGHLCQLALNGSEVGNS